MYEHVAVIDLFESGAKGGEQAGRQVAYESDRVVDDDLLFARQPQPPGCRIERGEHSLLGVDVACGQHVEQSGFASVGVADDGDNGKLAPCALFAALLSAMTLRFDLFLKPVDAVAHATAVCLKLGFTWAAPADTA